MFKYTPPISYSENLHHSSFMHILLDFSLSVKAAPHECVIRTGVL